LVSSEASPLHGLDIVLGNPSAVLIHVAEIVLGWCITLVRSEAKPLHSLDDILGNTSAAVIHVAEIELG